MKRFSRRLVTTFLAIAIVAVMLVPSLAPISADGMGAEFVSEFTDPSNEYRPKVRWWWPGGDITSEELVREINLLEDAGFGGAEMQPFDYSLDGDALTDPDSDIKDYMTDSFLSKVSDLLTEAQKLDMIMDINMGSGYCAGASFVPIEDNEKTLLSADITVTGDQSGTAIPTLGANYMYELFDPNNSNYIAPGWHTMNYMPENAELLYLYAAKVVDGERSSDYTVLNDTVTLDMSTVELISDYNPTSGTFNWTCPDSSEKWQIIAIYSMPVGSNPIGSVEVGAAGETSYMVDALNYAATIRYYENWLEQLEPIMQYTEDGTLRAAFNDSFEFFAQRIYTDGLLDTFVEVNGYDASPYLPTLLMPGKNQIANFFVPGRAAEYTFEDVGNGNMNTRINYDYDKAIAAGVIDGWYEASAEALGNSSLLFRQQGYNPPMDRIKATSYEDIPEAENNTIVTNKVVSSGAHFYDKTAVSAETFVFYTDEDGGGNYKITPETYRQQADLMITSGVNEMIYHGFPYVYNDDDGSYGVQNWSGFCSPYSGYDIGTTFSESDTFWPYVKSLNDYVSRLQYLMKQGDPSVDVLVYLPIFASETSTQFTEVTNLLDANGIAWDWVNEELIENATYSDGSLNINGKPYDALILPSIDSIELSTMQAIESLSENGAPVAVYKTAPSEQPSYNNGNYLALDNEVADLSSTVINRANSPLISTEAGLAEFVASCVNPEVSYEANANLNFVRRDYGDMGDLMFVRNISSDSTEYTLTFDQSVIKAYVLDARTGEIFEVPVSGGTLSGTLEGLDSVAILCSNSEQFDVGLLAAGDPIAQKEITDIALLDTWTLNISGQDVVDYTASGESTLGLWRDTDELKYCADPGLYTTTFTLDSINSAKDYILKLGTLYGVPEVSVNGSEFIAIPLEPYELDITEYLHTGENTVTVRLVVALRNRLLGYAIFGEDGNDLNKAYYTQFSASPIKTGMTEPASLIAVPTSKSNNGSSSSSGSSSDTSSTTTSSDTNSITTSSTKTSSSVTSTQNPFTGGLTSMLVWMVILCAGSTAVVVTIIVRKRKNYKT